MLPFYLHTVYAGLAVGYLLATQMVRPRFLNLQEVLDRHLFEGICCVYLLRCQPTGYSYVGSCKNLYPRLQQHIRRKHSAQLRQSFDSYGVAQHEVALLEICPCDFSDAELRAREAFWIWNYRARLNSQLPCLANGKLKWLFNPECQAGLSSSMPKQSKKVDSQSPKYPLQEAEMQKLQTLVSIYNDLAQENDAQIQAKLVQLKQLIDLQIQEIKTQEKPMIEAQNKHLSEIQRSLKRDARYLLGINEFKNFLQQMREPPKQSSEPDTNWFQPDGDPLSWSLTKLDARIKLNRFRLTEDREACDDEEIYTSYEYSLFVQIGQNQTSIKIQTGRLIHNDPNHYIPCSDLEQQQEILIQILEPFSQLPFEADQVDQLIKELSFLICFAGKLLSSTPRPFEFTYP